MWRISHIGEVRHHSNSLLRVTNFNNTASRHTPRHLDTGRGIVNKDILVVLGQDDLNTATDPAQIAFKIEKYWLHDQFQ